MSPKNLAIFASGSGTNAENIIRYFASHEDIGVVGIFSNNEKAGVHKRAEKLGVPSFVFTKEEFKSETFFYRLKEVDYIILAGFLWLIPEHLVAAFPDKIINIHPALLPKYGGKGMYGDFVHEAVIAAEESESGITIHLVNEEYDKGAILFQARCKVAKNDTTSSLAEKIHKLEYAHFPTEIERHIREKR